MMRAFLFSLALLTALPSFAADFQFDDTGVTAFVTPRATTYWYCTCLGSFAGSPSVAREYAIIADSDGDGVVRWELGSRMTPAGLWTMIDGAAGSVTTRTRQGAALIDPVAFPAKAFLRDETGVYSRFVVNDLIAVGTSTLNLFWVRPGVGAWVGVAANDGSVDELLLNANMYMYDVRGMSPVAGSPLTPPGVLNGDYFIVTHQSARFWTGGLVDPHLVETAGGGVIVFASAAGGEDEGKVTITLARTEGTDGAASVHYQTSDDSAHAGVHYQTTSGTAVYASGQILQSFDVPVIDDHVDAQSAAFKVTLGDASGAAVGQSSQRFPIADNDGTPRVTLERKTVNEDGSGPRETTLWVRLSHTAPSPVTLAWSSRDYFTGAERESGNVEFAVGEKEKSIVLHYTADDRWGANQRFRVVITNAVNATPPNSSNDGSLVVIDDDPKPVMSFRGVTVREDEGVAILTATLTAPIVNGYLFYCDTEDGTAAAPGDFVAQFQELVIPAGATSVTMSVPIVNDTVAEGVETFRVVLHGGLNSAQPMIATVTILDDEDGPSRRRTMRR